MITETSKFCTYYHCRCTKKLSTLLLSHSRQLLLHVLRGNVQNGSSRHGQRFSRTSRGTHTAAKANRFVYSRYYCAISLVSHRNSMNMTTLRANATADAPFQFYGRDEVTGVGGKDFLFIDISKNMATTTTDCKCRLVCSSRYHKGEPIQIPLSGPELAIGHPPWPVCPNLCVLSI